MHLIRRRGMRRALVLLIAMSGLLAVPALALAHSVLSLVSRSPGAAWAWSTTCSRTRS